jgi:hypothetical protein
LSVELENGMNLLISVKSGLLFGNFLLILVKFVPLVDILMNFESLVDNFVDFNEFRITG